MIFNSIFLFVVMQRLIELLVAKRNEKQMRERGAYEVGAQHYPWMILLHTSFLCGLFIEVELGSTPNVALLAIFCCLQLARIWCIRSLGSFWNTKILILPGAQLVAKGPYAYVRHPNYVIVCLEILVLPLMFGAYVTAILFTLLNAAMLTVRILVEERALRVVELDLKEG
ncbi:MAG: isoprenylcysteine carboxylmethyltransferase family protein [Solibacillus sp.]